MERSVFRSGRDTPTFKMPLVVVMMILPTVMMLTMMMMMHVLATLTLSLAAGATGELPSRCSLLRVFRSGRSMPAVDETQLNGHEHSFG